VLRLGGALALGGLLAACGSDAGDGSSGSSATAGGTSGGTTDGFVLATRYPVSKALTPGEVRLAVSLADQNASLITDGPATLVGRVRNEQGATVTEFEAPRRGAGLSVPYWSITANLPTRGLYDLQVEGAVGDPAPFLVWDTSEVTVPSPTMALPPFDTPTLTDARGVDPVCTRSGEACPFHEVTLTDALGAGLPVVYMIGTPAHCQFATCGPGLDFLIDLAPAYAGKATFVHAEVYADPEATTVAPAVDAAGLDYEPVIWITDATGTITRRIDIVWDEEELAAMLAASLA
jgi:hypothetical protein